MIPCLFALVGIIARSIVLFVVWVADRHAPDEPRPRVQRGPTSRPTSPDLASNEARPAIQRAPTVREGSGDRGVRGPGGPGTGGTGDRGDRGPGGRVAGVLSGGEWSETARRHRRDPVPGWHGSVCPSGFTDFGATLRRSPGPSLSHRARCDALEINQRLQDSKPVPPDPLRSSLRSTTSPALRGGGETAFPSPGPPGEEAQIVRVGDWETGPGGGGEVSRRSGQGPRRVLTRSGGERRRSCGDHDISGACPGRTGT